MKYIGLDAHASTCEFCVMNSKGEIIDQAKIATNGRLLVGYIRGIKGSKKMTFEECELSHWLYELMKKEVDELIVCDPVANKEYKGAKTDKLDAKRLADLLRGNFLTGVYHDGSARERFRVLMSGYQDLMEEGTRLKNRYRDSNGTTTVLSEIVFFRFWKGLKKNGRNMFKRLKG
jgi:transposase